MSKRTRIPSRRLPSVATATVRTVVDWMEGRIGQHRRQRARIEKRRAHRVSHRHHAPSAQRK